MPSLDLAPLLVQIAILGVPAAEATHKKGQGALGPCWAGKEIKWETILSLWVDSQVTA